MHVGHMRRNSDTELAIPENGFHAGRQNFKWLLGVNSSERSGKSIVPTRCGVKAQARQARGNNRKTSASFMAFARINLQMNAYHDSSGRVMVLYPISCSRELIDSVTASLSPTCNHNPYFQRSLYYLKRCNDPSARLPRTGSSDCSPTGLSHRFAALSFLTSARNVFTSPGYSSIRFIRRSINCSWALSRITSDSDAR